MDFMHRLVIVAALVLASSAQTIGQANVDFDPGTTTQTTTSAHMNECGSNPCAGFDNAVGCVDGVNAYTCECAPGYAGAQCRTDINECDSSPCQNNGSCTDNVNSFQCTCVFGYEGTNCSLNTNECVSNPCQNGGTCTDGVNSFSCTCAPGFTGDNCSVNINECYSEPCKNSGVCQDEVNSYTCSCTDNYIGTHCQHTDECAKENGGCQQRCVDTEDSYRCECDLSAYRLAEDKHNCMDINECNDERINRCDQICVNRRGGYFCRCGDGFTLSGDRHTCTEP